MPKIKTVSVNYERKVNLGDYNSAAVGCTLWADVEDGEDLNAAMQSLWQCAKENVKANLVPTAKNGSMKTQDYFLGLPLELQPEAKRGIDKYDEFGRNLEQLSDPRLEK